MEQRNLKWPQSTEPVQSDQLLASHYRQLVKWATVLTRGDAGKAEEIVQEFCLYIALTKPDLNGVANLDGYLYTCLRHIYLSTLARASREALHFVSIEDFDSFAFAVTANLAGDPLQQQNDLRRICAYSVWRKESSKSASYFILHFFHGYARREIAEIARLPISAIYNKLKTARAEVRTHLEQPGKLRVVNRDRPPEPALSWSLLSSAKLFAELRQTVLQARHTDCLAEEELLQQYRSGAGPISCPLLAHIVSCERCLAVVDREFRRPTLKDREPLDVFGSTGQGDGYSGNAQGSDADAMLRSVHKRWGRVHEHRPKALSIAINGQIIAFHDVRAEHNKLSARLDNPEKALFAEVFSEQGVRLALLPVGAPPPEGPEACAQRVTLSDERWLELSLTYDGLGLHSEVAYFDPALAPNSMEDWIEDNAEDLPVATIASASSHLEPATTRSRWGAFYNSAARVLGVMRPSSPFAWALTLILLAGTSSYLLYRHKHASMNAAEVLQQSLTAETENLRGQTVHQVLRMEAISSDGRILQRGMVDVWKDGDGRRYLRRLYDAQHRMVAIEWKGKSGKAGKTAPLTNRGLAVNGLWDQDLSAQAFAALGGKPPEVRAIRNGHEDGYELTRVGPTAAHPQLISATLVLDSNLQPIRQTIRVHAGSQVHELHFVQANYERKPSASVPDAVFDPDLEHPGRDRNLSGARPRDLVEEMGSVVPSAELQIAVLYQLFSLGADAGAPIEVVTTPSGHIRVSGAVTDDALKQAIAAHLATLPSHQLIDLKLVSPRDVSTQVSANRRSHLEGASVYELGQGKSAADETLRKYLQGKGLTGEALTSAVGQFSRDALQHAQRALQHAYDLDRLSAALSSAEDSSLSAASQQQWTQMVEKHASDLETELRGLDAQLAEIVPSAGNLREPRNEIASIENRTDFSRAAGQLLRQARDLNQQVGDFFTSNAVAAGQADHDPPFSTTMDTVPVHQAEEMARFATKLNHSSPSAMLKEHDSESGQEITGPPR
jgi:DNA-directed RNA polymerase specialized sigma24 family protein